MLIILVQWILHKTPNRLLQYHLGVHIDLCIFGALPPIQHFSNIICPSVTQNELLRPSPLLHRSPLSYFWLLSGSTPKNFSNFSHSLSAAAFAAGIFKAWGTGINLWTKFLCCSDLLPFSGNMVFMMSWQWFSHSQSCRFASFQNARKSCFNFIGCTTPTILLHNFAGHSRSNWCFQFLTSILNGLLWFLVLRVNEIDSSQFSFVIQMELLIWPLLLLLQLGILSHFLPEFWP